MGERSGAGKGWNLPGKYETDYSSPPILPSSLLPHLKEMVINQRFQCKYGTNGVLRQPKLKIKK